MTEDMNNKEHATEMGRKKFPDLIDFILLFWNEKKKIIYITAGFIVIGLIYALLSDPWYKATVNLLPTEGGSNRILNQYSNLAALAGINLGGDTGDKYALYPEIIKSNFILDRILKHKFKTKTFENPVTLFEFWDTEIDSSKKNWRHKMYEEAKIKLKEKAKLIYKEVHYHGDRFGTKIETNFKVFVGQKSGFENKFVIDKGSIGKLKVNFKVQLEKESFCKVLNKVIGKGKKDEVEIYDKILLNGENSSSLNKLRGVAINGGKMFFKGETEATKKAKNARGHIDCQEIIIGENSIVQSTPIIIVKNPEARVTHEASIGKINQKELETLMSRGLSEKEAIDFVIKGMAE